MAKATKLYDGKFRNWLLYLVASRQNLKAIAGYTLRALQQDGALFQAPLDRLQPLHDSFDDTLTQQASAGAARSAHTLQASTTYQLIKQFMKRAYKLHFAALEETNPALFKEFFPAGRSEFSDATRKGIGTSFARFIGTLQANQAALPGGATLLSEAQALAEQHTAARAAQDKRKKQVRTASSDLAADETDLLVELFGAYAALLAHYYRTPERVADYFDFSMLSRRRNDDAEDAADAA